MKRPGRMVREVLDSVFRKAATTRYPYGKYSMPEKFRGKLDFCAEKCIGCRMCMKDCPTNAITIRKVGEKQFEAEIDLARCIYCAQCVDTCPKKALDATGDFELAGIDRAKMKVVYRGKPASEPEKKT